MAVGNTSIPDTGMPRRNEQSITWRSSLGQTVITRGHEVFVLGADETIVWQLCDGCHDMRRIQEKLAEGVHGVSENTVRVQLHQFLTGLTDRGLISLQPNDATTP